MKRLQALETWSARLLGGWLPGIARWETKHDIGLHLWEDLVHSRELRSRLWELRVEDPDRGLPAAIEHVVRAIASAQHDFEFLAGVYHGLKRGLLESYECLLRTVHTVHDAPSVPMLRRIIEEKRGQLAWADRTLMATVDTGERKRVAKRWVEFVRASIEAARLMELDGPTLPPPPPPALPPGYGLLLPWPEARRDERFKLSLAGMPPPAEGDELGRTIFQFFNYTQEMQAAETLGSVLWETDAMPWEYHFDVGRHAYDEVRHARLGETRLAELGHAVTDFPNCVANYAWRQLCDPMRRYCVLTYVIEADSFAYKHTSYQDYLAREDLASAEAVLADIIDETLHVRWGRKWTPKMMEMAGYAADIDTLVRECRSILARHTTNPLQRASNASKLAACPAVPVPPSS